MKLLGADSLRDGGSLVAFFRRDDGRLLSICLEVAPWDDPRGRIHGAELRVSDDIHPEHGRILVRQSDDETSLLADLDAWLAAPAYSFEWSRTLGLDALERVRHLRTKADIRTA